MESADRGRRPLCGGLSRPATRADDEPGRLELRHERLRL